MHSKQWSEQYFSAQLSGSEQERGSSTSSPKKNSVLAHSFVSLIVTADESHSRQLGIDIYPDFSVEH